MSSSSTRYFVVDVPTVGPQMGQITQLWDGNISFSDAHMLRKQLANRRLSKWPVVLDNVGIAAAPKAGVVVHPKPNVCELLKIDPAKFAAFDEMLRGEPVTVIAGDQPPGYSADEIAQKALAAAQQATAEANARVKGHKVDFSIAPGDPDYPTDATIDAMMDDVAKLEAAGVTGDDRMTITVTASTAPHAAIAGTEPFNEQ